MKTGIKYLGGLLVLVTLSSRAPLAATAVSSAKTTVGITIKAVDIVPNANQKILLSPATRIVRSKDPPKHHQYPKTHDTNDRRLTMIGWFSVLISLIYFIKRRDDRYDQESNGK